MDRNQILSRRSIESMIADGHIIVISQGRVMQLDGWMAKHPGGKLPLLHMIGHDASNEIAVYHSAKTLRMMSAYCIGRIDGPWVNFTPPIRGGTFRKSEPADEGLDEELDEELADEGQSFSSEESTVSEQSSESGGTEYSDGPLLFDSGESSASDGGSAKGGTIEACLRGPRISGLDLTKAAMPLPLPAYIAPLTPAALPKGRDARISDAMQAEIDECLTTYPALDAESQAAITAKYEALQQRAHTEGFYTCDYANYHREIARYCLLLGVFLATLRAGWYLTSATFLGLFWHQIMFSAHDAGHLGITHRFVTDTLIGIFIADFCCGLSIGWWKSSHNVHHLVTNSPEHDPDIQNTPLFALCPSQFSDTTSTYYDFTFVWDKACELFVPYQKYAYYPVMAIARFNLYFLSWCHLLSPRSRPLGAAAWTRPAELVAMCGYWYVFGYLLVWQTLPDWQTRTAFVLTSHMSAFILHVQITLSHWGMPTCDLGSAECFAQRQLRTTMDVECPKWLDWVHGGLQFQAIHHLFPRVPRHNLRNLQPLVREFCEQTGIKYTTYGFLEGNGCVLGRLGDISNQLAMLGKCQAVMAATGESGLH